MFQYDDGGNPVLLGVVSIGVECAEPNYPGVYVRTASHNRFIPDDVTRTTQTRAIFSDYVPSHAMNRTLIIASISGALVAAVALIAVVAVIVRRKRENNAAVQPHATATGGPIIHAHEAHAYGPPHGGSATWNDPPPAYVLNYSTSSLQQPPTLFVDGAGDHPPAPGMPASDGMVYTVPGGYGMASVTSANDMPGAYTVDNMPGYHSAVAPGGTAMPSASAPQPNPDGGTHGLHAMGGASAGGVLNDSYAFNEYDPYEALRTVGENPQLGSQPGTASATEFAAVDSNMPSQGGHYGGHVAGVTGISMVGVEGTSASSRELASANGLRPGEESNGSAQRPAGG